jgi:hypothetical protein
MTSFPKTNCDFLPFDQKTYNCITTYFWPHEIQRLETRVSGLFAKSFQNEEVWEEIGKCLNRSGFRINGTGRMHEWGHKVTRLDIESYYSFMTTIVVGDLSIWQMRAMKYIFRIRNPLKRFNALRMHLHDQSALSRAHMASTLVETLVDDTPHLHPFHCHLDWNTNGHYPTFASRTELGIEAGMIPTLIALRQSINLKKDSAVLISIFAQRNVRVSEEIMLRWVTQAANTGNSSPDRDPNPVTHMTPNRLGAAATAAAGGGLPLLPSQLTL